MRRILWLLVLAALLGGCDNPNAPKPGPGPVVVDSFGADQVVAAVNAERKKAGRDPLAVSPALAREAARYAGVMAQKGQLSHTLEGDFGARIRRAGYDGAAYGENIAYNYRSLDSLVQGWMNSPGHRQNILNASYTETGVGVAFSAQGQPYYCQDFGRPR